MRHMTAGLMSFAALVFCANAVASSDLSLTTEEKPPFNFADPKTGEATGLSTGVVSEIMRRTGTDFKIQILPWTRAYQQALDDAKTCVYTTAISDERKSRFKFVAPIAFIDWVLLARAEDSLKIASLDDAKPYTIGAYRNGAVGQYLAERGFRLDLVGVEDLNPGRLAAGRIDFWAANLQSALLLMRKTGITNLRPVATIRHIGEGLACNPAVPDQQIVAMQQALDEIRTDGTMDRLVAQYQ